MKRLNWNTLILTVGFSILGWGAKEIYHELRNGHDDILVIKTDMVSRKEFDTQMQDVKSRQSATDVRLAQVELELRSLRKSNQQ